MTVDTHDLLAFYQEVERTIRGSQARMLKQLEQRGWPVPRSSVFDEFNGIRRSVFAGLMSICLTTTRDYSSGSSAN